MKNIGYLLLAAGFLAGAFATSLDVQNVNWTMFGAAAAAAIIGLIVFKRQVSAHARSDAVLETNRGELRFNFTFFQAGASFQAEIVPEPASLLTILVTGVFTLVRRARRPCPAIC